MIDEKVPLKRDFFISFNKADRPWAEWIAWILEEAGFLVLFQDWDFHGNFVLEMHRAHEACHRTIAVLSPDYLTSGFTSAEWAARLAEDADSGHDFLIAVRVRECAPTGMLKAIIYTDLFGLDRDAAKQRLLDRIRRIRRKPDEEPAFPGVPSAAAQRAVPAEPRFPVPVHNLPLFHHGFVGRERELAAVRNALATGGKAAVTQPQALTGLGGVGKTQTALAYAYRHLADYRLIGWLRAEEPSTLAADYAALAAHFNLDPTTPNQPALIKQVRAQLEFCADSLLIFDDAPDPMALDPYLPRIGGGDMLITSRRQHWMGRATVIQLSGLAEEDAIRLLIGEDKDSTRREEARQLSEELGHLPLALAQARAYVDRLNVDLATYRRRLAESHSRVLGWRPTDAAYPLAVAEAWTASVAAAEKERSGARPLLELLSFFAPEALPRVVLGACPDLLPPSLVDEQDRDEALAALNGLSLTTANPDTVATHRLVQAVTRDRLDEAVAKARAETAVRLVSAAWRGPPGARTPRPKPGPLLPHVLASAAEAERGGVARLATATLLYDVALHHESQAAFAEAELLYRRAILLGEKSLGPEHPDLAPWLDSLADLYWVTERYEEAEAPLERAVAITTSLPADHPSRRSARNAYANFLDAVGRHQEIAPLRDEASDT